MPKVLDSLSSLGPSGRSGFGCEKIFPCAGWNTKGGDTPMYWVNKSGEAQGPYTLDQLRSMWSHGVLTADTAYYDPEESNWKLLRSFFEREKDIPFSPKNPPPPPPKIIPPAPAARIPLPPPSSQSSPKKDVMRYIFLPEGRIGRLEMLGMHLVYLVVFGALIAWIYNLGSDAYPAGSVVRNRLLLVRVNAYFQKIA